jgi:hypothetical protein
MFNNFKKGTVKNSSAGAPTNNPDSVYGLSGTKAMLASSLPVIVGMLRFVSMLGLTVALLVVHFLFGRQGFALVITHDVEVHILGLTSIMVSAGVICILLETVSAAAQTVLWDLMLNKQLKSNFMKAVFGSVMVLCVLVNISVVTYLMYGESTLNIFPAQRDPIYPFIALFVGVITLCDCYFIAQGISFLRTQTSSSVFGDKRIRKTLSQAVLYVVALVRMVIMFAGTLALLTISFVMLEVGLSLFFKHDSGFLASVLAFGTVSASVFLTEVLLYSKEHQASRGLKIALGTVVGLTGVFAMSAVPYIMFGDSPLSILPAAEHISLMYFVVAALVFLFVVLDSYFVYQFLESLKGDGTGGHGMKIPGPGTTPQPSTPPAPQPSAPLAPTSKDDTP